MFRSGHVIVSLVLCICALSCLAVCPLNACLAAVHERDWKSLRDGLLTYDDVHQREWLDLNMSRLAQFAGSTVEDQYQNGILEIRSGGLFDGFVVAKGVDVLALAESAGIDTTSSSFSRNGVATQSLITLLEPTVNRADGSMWTFGLLDEFPTYPPIRERLQSFIYYYPIPESPFARAAVSIGIQDPIAYPNVGIMLYRNVPELEGRALALVSIAIGCALRARWK